MSGKGSKPVIPFYDFKMRWKKVQAMMQRRGIDLVIAYADDRAVFGAAHARYLANLPVHFEPVCILMPPEGEPVLLCGPETDEYARLIGCIKDVRVLKEFTHPDEDYPFSKIDGLSKVVAETVSSPAKIHKIGIAAGSLIPEDTASAIKRAFPDASRADVESAMCALRAVKSKAEIDVIRYAYKIAQIGLNAAVGAVKPGITEREVAAEAEYAMRRMGAEGTGIDTIVASGPNTRPILARTTFRKIRSDDLVLITVAPRYEGYHGAIGRPVIVGSPPREILKSVDVACRAQQACSREVRPGVEGRKVEAIGRSIVGKAGLGKYFLYSGIHSVGVIEFEPPIFGPGSTGKLRKDMVISIDIPMFNAPWGGLRVEDGYLVTESGAERLNRTPYKIKRN